MSDFSMDTREFKAAFEQVLSATKKDAPAYLNKKALMVVIGGKGVKGAIQLTPRAKASEIKSIPVKVIAKMVMARAKANGEKLTHVEIGRRVKREIARRAASVGYTAGPGWHKAAVALGGRGVRLRKEFSESKAAKGTARKASPGSLLAEIVNTAPAAAIIGKKALQNAVDNVAADMSRYGAEQLLKKQFKKASA